MLQKFLKEIVVSIAGKQAEGIIDLLDGQKYINEYLIAKKLNLTVNQTRNLLYKISDRGLVSFIRKKDKRKGWYTYFWKLEILKCLDFLREELLRKMNQISHQIKSRETKEFYICERCGIEYSEETALVHNFMCSECGDIVSRRDNTPVIKEYNKSLDKLKRDLGYVEQELKLEREKTEKTKQRRIKKDESKKKLERSKNRAINKKMKDSVKKHARPKKRVKVSKKSVKKKKRK